MNIERRLEAHLELTRIATPSTLRRGVSFMAEGQSERPSQPGGEQSAGKPGEQKGQIFADSDVNDADTRSVLDLITEFEGIPQEIREEAQRKLAEERGMSLETGEEKQKAIKEALPAKGEAMVENLAGAAPAPIMPDYRTRRNDAITGLGDLALTDPELMSIQKQIVSAKAAATAARRELDSELLIPMLERFTNLLQGEEGRLKTAPSSELVSFQNIVKEIGTLDALMRGKGRAEDTFLLAHQDLSQKIREALGAGNLTVVKALRREQKNLVKKFVGEVNVSETGIRDDTLRIVVEDDEALMQLSFKIVGSPFQSETGDYILGFYGEINIFSITNLLQSLSENRNLTPKERTRLVRAAQLRDISWIREGARVSHQMNKFIVSNELDKAHQISEELRPEYSQILQKWRGVSTVQRLLETAHAITISRDGYINVENNQVMMGTSTNDATGRLKIKQKESVFQEFKNQIDYFKRYPDSAPAELKVFLRMEDWEIALAFNLGRNFLNIETRKAQWESQGQTPAGSRAWESIPQEGFARIMNPAKWLWWNFTIGQGRGGIRVLERFMDAMHRRRGTEGFGSMQLEKIRDEKIKFFELPWMTGVRDWIASWRAIGAVLRRTAAVYEPQPGTELATKYRVFHKQSGSNRTEIAHDTSLGLMLNTGAIEFQEIADPKKRISFGKADDRIKADYFRSVLFKPGTGMNGVPPELRDDIQTALGVVYRVVLTPEKGKSLRDNPEFNMVKEQARTLIWQRVARENPLIALSLLHGLKYSKDHPEVTFIDPATGNPVTINVANRASASPVSDEEGLVEFFNRPGIDWLAFQRKLNLYNEIKLAKIRGSEKDAPIPNFTLSQAMALVETTTGGFASEPGFNLSPEEKVLLQEIEKEGLLASHDMANVRYAFVPFLSDVNLEKIDYRQPGQIAPGRHFGDLAQFHESGQAILDAASNMGEFRTYKDIVEFIKKFAKGITSVHGDEYAKDKSAAVIEAVFGFFRRGENVVDKDEEFPGEDKLIRRQRLARWFKQMDEVHEISQALHKPNSEAQNFYNSTQVPALDRRQMFNAMEDLKGAGLMGREEEKEMRKRFGGLLGFVLRLLIQDLTRVAKLGLLGAAAQFLKESSSPKGISEPA
ncbi:hypothetical protein A2971_02375 [Candidatus Gottesmanbacteria bacterium RIFCSPLOWO2_01_FULL_46_21]|uniref:Uncharacterized protein n=1 Tax=Candidatus Gottesmanbacteria bacterium RIFCSPLOWO2_01_FULL_46_21 TaxID=1798393 RepID=A0A1F6AXV5_9BACT|nr:MAG: hypothetical protein A2971_02375 [Candidatus Gottesmanbacteria bacterium RIFCSPLOWO2_01_FULL_46_21]